MATSRGKKNHSSCLPAFVLPIVAVILLLFVLLIAGLYSLPSQAVKIFGPPGVHLSKQRLIFYSAILIWQKNDLTNPTNPLGAAQPFSVTPGESTTSVIGRLWDSNLIKNPGAFRTYLYYTGLDLSLQAGDYQLSPAMTPIEIAQMLQDATPAQVTFQVMAGWRLEEIAAALPTSGLSITPEEFLSAAHSRPAGYFFTTDLPKPVSLEGYMFPDAYVLSRKINQDDFIKIILDRFEEQVTSDIRQGFSHQGLSLHEGITLASIVQKEAMREEEMPIIASVFYNRLAKGMKLDSDPTVQYALGYNAQDKTWWTNPLSLDDLKVDSRYNTYMNAGLPPGPIANPGLAALKAVAFPASTPYYYFRSACDNSGRHVFSETFDEHLNKACP
jgi:UPF0755 protein